MKKANVEIDERRGLQWVKEHMSNPIPEVYPGEAASTYYVEALSECNLKCAMCAFGSKELFQRKAGMMDMELFTKIVDKIAQESPHATVSPYHHCEPMLHPHLPEMVKIIKEHGLQCAISFNFNKLNRLKELLLAKPDAFEISVSGFYQETYSKSHVGGDVEAVKRNLCELRRLMDETGVVVRVLIIYHMYKDNLGEEFDLMKEFCEKLGFIFQPCWSRSISMEMSLKYLREKRLSRYQGETLKWFDELPPLNQCYYDTLARMTHLPENYLEGEWSKISIEECPVNHRVVNIRWNGKLSMCSWAFDDRAMFMDYLTTPLERLWEARKNYSICKECLANNYALYTNFFDMDGIDKQSHESVDKNMLRDRGFYADEGEELQDVLEFCKLHEERYIFGAGLYGNKMKNFLEKKGISFRAFLVSNGREGENSCEDVKPISYVEDKDKDKMGIIVALDREHRREVRSMLEQTGIDIIYVKNSVFK